MRRLFILFAIVTSFGTLSARENPFAPPAKKYFDTVVAQRGWLVRASYNRQNIANYGELGFGRLARLQHFDEMGRDVTSASASFTFGAEFGYDSSATVAPKLSIEIAAIALGARVGYAYYMKDNRSTGVICIEGGFNIVSRVFVYAGYNFVKRKWDAPIIPEGPRFSIGFNFPFGIRRVQPPKSPTHL